MLKICSKCKGEKSLEDFYSAGFINGKEYFRGDCKDCHKKSTTERQKSVRREYSEWKRSLKCNRCGFSDHRALQLHHEGGGKDHNVSDMVCKGFSLDKIKAEAEKCEVLCANCHQIHHSPL